MKVPLRAFVQSWLLLCLACSTFHPQPLHAMTQQKAETNQDPETISSDQIAEENQWWKDLGASVPSEGIVLKHPWAKPYTGRSLIVPRAVIAKWFNQRNQPNATINAAQLRADLPLLRLVMEKNYSGWEIAAEHGWNWEAWFKSWDADLAKSGAQDIPLGRAFAAWDEYQHFQLDNHSGLVKADVSVRSRSALLKDKPQGNCSQMKMQDGKSYPMAVNDPSQQPHKVYAWSGTALSPAAYISYPASRGDIAWVVCGGKTIAASVFSGYSAADNSSAVAPLVAPPQGASDRDPFYAMLAPGIGYVRLPGFSEAQDEAFRKLVLKLPPEAGHEKTVIFDLRGNEGGSAPLDNLATWIPDRYLEGAAKLDQRVKGSCFLPGLRFGLLQLLTWRVQPPVSASLLDSINKSIEGLSNPIAKDCPVSFQESKSDWSLSQHHFTPGDAPPGARIILLTDSGCGSDCEYFIYVAAAVPGSVIVGSSTFGLAGFTQPGFFYLPHAQALFRIATSVTRPYGDNRTIDGYGLSADVVLPSAASQTKEAVIGLAELLDSAKKQH